MSKQTFVRVATCIFILVGAVHLYRAFMGIPILFGMTVIPVVASCIAGVCALLLAYVGYKHWR